MTIISYEKFILRQIGTFHSFQNGSLKVADVDRLKILTVQTIRYQVTIKT